MRNLAREHVHKAIINIINVHMIIKAKSPKTLKIFAATFLHAIKSWSIYSG